ncbi:MAG: PAS domain S-box protein [Oceanisphaera sp.]|uniref:PAS domain S-box protein n=1 Tax=Oceanisphaera sp. TaxID=1929979 RepID=UPI003C74C2A8
MFYNEANECEMYCIDVDLSDVKKAQAQAVMKDDLLKAVFETNPDLFFLMTEDGVFINYHAGDSKTLYVTPTGIIGSNIADFLPDKVVARFLAYIAQAIKLGGIVSFEYELAMPTGASYFEARVSHLPEHKQVVLIIRDITEQYKAAELIRKQAYYDTFIRRILSGGCCQSLL